MNRRTLVLARHAPTGNAKMHVISGTLDEPLSDDGRRQLDAYAAEYGPVSADVVLSSPLSRAVDTAIRLSGLPRERIEVWDDLRDRNYGLLQGIAPEEVAVYRPTIEYISAGGIDHSVNPPGGETLDELRERAEQVAARLMDRDEPRILLISHQAFMQQLGGVLDGVGHPTGAGLGHSGPSDRRVLVERPAPGDPDADPWWCPGARILVTG